MTIKLVFGQRFGRLTAVSKIGSRNKKIIWSFSCDCGSAVDLAATFVVRGHTSSCGCLRIERSRESVLSDIAGHTFGRLKVLQRAGYSDQGRVMWTCICECGAITETSGKNLLNGTKVSCGCRKIAASKENIAARVVDYIGVRFGKLVVAGRSNFSTKYAQRWDCLCDCGNPHTVGHSDLQQGKTISCGCAMQDKKVYMTEKARQYGSTRNSLRRALVKGAEGSFTAAEIEDLFQKQCGKCACCRIKLGKSYHRDHITALINGGTNYISNIQLLCIPCHLTKGTMDPIAWVQKRGLLI